MLEIISLKVPREAVTSTSMFFEAHSNQLAENAALPTLCLQKEP